MKIIIINASPRLHGSTSAILRIMREYLEKKNETQIIYYNLADLEMSYCKECCYCFKHGKCFMQDDAEKLSNNILDADGLIIGTPTYASNVSGHLKTFIDRGHFVLEQLLRGKYALGIITSENYGAFTVAKILKNLFLYSGATMSLTKKYKLPFSNSPQINRKQRDNIQKSAENFYRNIKEKRISIFQKLKHKIIFHIGIKPFVIKKGLKYQGVIERWKRQNMEAKN